VQYYYLNDIKRVGKIEKYVPYLYDKEKGWVYDNENLLMDRIMGYDGEFIGCSSMLFAIDEITEEQAKEIIEKLYS